MTLAEEIDEILLPYMGGLNAEFLRNEILAATGRHLERFLLDNMKRENVGARLITPVLHMCTICHRVPVDVQDGFDTCASCSVM